MMHWLPVILVLPYLLILFKIHKSLLKIRPFSLSTSPGTFVSVVIPCRNEQNNIPAILKSIAEQDYPRRLFEVIIVDDNSSDRTFEIASDFTEITNLTTIKNDGTGKKQAIRTGINISCGKLIITTDADCRVGKIWIKTIAAFFDNHKPDMIICPVQIEDGSGFFGKFQELEFLSLQGITAGSAISGNAVMCNGANLSFTREAYLKNSNNLHNELASGEDVFFLHSLKKNKLSKIDWLEANDAIATTASSPTFGSFLKQRSRWISKGKAYNDRFTIILGIVTFVTIILQFSVLITAFINPSFIGVFIAIFLVKSIPDFLILKNTSVRYGKKRVMKWFIPAQIVYPLYVLCVVFYSLIKPRSTEC